MQGRLVFIFRSDRFPRANPLEEDGRAVAGFFEIELCRTISRGLAIAGNEIGF